MVANNKDSAIDSKLDAMGPSADLTSTWKEDRIQQEPADETKGYSPIGIVRAEGKDAVKSTTTEVTDIDKRQVTLSETTYWKKGGKDDH